jgi:hypothetical protein
LQPGGQLDINGSDELLEKREVLAGGFAEYAFTFQTAILVILATLFLWGLAGLAVFDRRSFWNCPSWSYFAIGTTLYASVSLTLLSAVTWCLARSGCSCYKGQFVGRDGMLVSREVDEIFYPVESKS